MFEIKIEEIEKDWHSMPLSVFCTKYPDCPKHPVCARDWVKKLKYNEIINITAQVK